MSLQNVLWNIKRLQCKSELDSSDKICSHRKLFLAYLTEKVLKAQKDTCYLHISRGILLARQAGKSVHSYENRSNVSIFFFVWLSFF